MAQGSRSQSNTYLRPDSDGSDGTQTRSGSPILEVLVVFARRLRRPGTHCVRGRDGCVVRPRAAVDDEPVDSRHERLRTQRDRPSALEHPRTGRLRLAGRPSDDADPLSRLLRDNGRDRGRGPDRSHTGVLAAVPFVPITPTAGVLGASGAVFALLGYLVASNRLSSGLPRSSMSRSGCRSSSSSASRSRSPSPPPRPA